MTVVTDGEGISLYLSFQEKGMPAKTAAKKLIEFLDEDRSYVKKLDCLQEIVLNLRYEGRHHTAKNLKQMGEVLNFFNGELMEHIKLEEEIAFPFIQKYIPRLDPFILLLSSQHEEFKRNLRKFEFWFNGLKTKFLKKDFDQSKLIEKVKETGNYLVYLLQNHLEEETRILYEVTEDTLRPEEKKELIQKIRNWHRMRAAELQGL